jgi:ribose-phosphate pyrophosphokinase
MKTMLFSFPGNEVQTERLAHHAKLPVGELQVHRFPDGESLVRIVSDVKDMRVILVCTLDRPDDKIIPLCFTARTMKEFGAAHVELVAPYLAYMRQDKRFLRGEAITSRVFAQIISEYFDRLITVDPHLHRYQSLSEIYSIPTEAVHASGAIGEWIRKNVERPLLIGPDEESRQWVEAVAQKANAPFNVLDKIRKGDHEVDVSLPDVENYRDHTPVLVDDIISTGRTMIETIGHLRTLKMKPAVCMGVHAVFSGDAYEHLKASGAGQIVTCTAIPHESNAIDLAPLLVHVL